jgi:hypothetical protein
MTHRINQSRRFEERPAKRDFRLDAKEKIHTYRQLPPTSNLHPLTFFYTNLIWLSGSPAGTMG